MPTGRSPFLPHRLAYTWELTTPERRVVMICDANSLFRCIAASVDSPKPYSTVWSTLPSRSTVLRRAASEGTQHRPPYRHARQGDQGRPPKPARPFGATTKRESSRL